MARLQILELPEGSGDERPPYILVVDQVPRDEPAFEALRRDLNDGDLAQRTGARAVLVFEDTIDIPANDTSGYLQQVAEEVLYSQGKVTREPDGPRLAAERTDIVRDMDRLAKWKNELTDALGLDRTRDWTGIRNAARGLRRDRDAQAETLERIRNLPEQPECMHTQHANPSGYLHGYGVAIREAKRATYPPERAETSEPGPATDA